MVKNVILEINVLRDSNGVIFNMVFLDTGEIRQKRRSLEWLMKRVFYHENRTREKKYGEKIIYDQREQS